MGIPLTSGWYWMNQQGIGGREGEPAEFQLVSAAAQEQAFAQATQRRRQSQPNSRGEYLNNSPNGYGGIQGGCAHVSSGDLTIMTPGC